MLDEYRIEQMGVGAYVDSIDEEVITVDQPESVLLVK